MRGLCLREGKQSSLKEGYSMPPRSRRLLPGRSPLSVKLLCYRWNTVSKSNAAPLRPSAVP